METPRFLVHGVDTAQCAYYLVPQGPDALDFTKLRVLRDELRESKDGAPRAFHMGDLEFLLWPSGTSTGYPFQISNADFRIAFGDKNTPSFFVTYSSHALWREPLASLQQQFLDWAASIGYVPIKPETLSRVDFAFDYEIASIDFDEQSFVSLSSKDSQYREDGKIQTFTFGKSDVVLRVYDKIAEIEQQSRKEWFFDIWGINLNVWRIEWQIRKEVLRRFGIRTVQDLNDQRGDLLRYLATKHDSLRIPSTDTNRARWPLHPACLPQGLATP